jgi:hypothetical protein
MEKHEVEQVLKAIRGMEQSMKDVKNRLISVESWLAALSKGKDLHQSHSFAKNIEGIKQRMQPLEIEGDGLCGRQLELE